MLRIGPEPAMDSGPHQIEKVFRDEAAGAGDADPPVGDFDQRRTRCRTRSRRFSAGALASFRKSAGVAGQCRPHKAIDRIKQRCLPWQAAINASPARRVDPCEATDATLEDDMLRLISPAAIRRSPRRCRSR
jgi:hypothetical protein